MSNGSDLNLDSGGSVTCGLGRNIFLSGSKEAAQNIRGRFESLCQELTEQSLGFLQVERVEAFGEPAVDRSEKSASFIPLALIANTAAAARAFLYAASVMNESKRLYFGITTRYEDCRARSRATSRCVSLSLYPPDLDQIGGHCRGA